MLTFALIAAGVSALAAVLAWVRARAAASRAERLAESYWELRYEIGQAKVRIDRLESAAGLRDSVESDTAAPRSAPTTSFVPLSSLKK